MRCIRDAHAAGWPELADTPTVARSCISCEPSATLRCHGLRTPGRPKRTLFDFYFTRVSIDGMTGPFFLETLANGTLLPFERAATVAHEWSHLAGYADESEANFVGWLVCMRGPAARSTAAGSRYMERSSGRCRDPIATTSRSGSTRARAQTSVRFPIAFAGTQFLPPAARATRSTIDF